VKREQTERALLDLGDLRNYALNDVAIASGVFLRTLKLEDDACNTTTASRENVVLCHGFGAGLGFFFKNYRGIQDGLNKDGEARWDVYGLDWLGMGRSSRAPLPTISKCGGDEGKKKGIEETIAYFCDSLEAWRIAVLGPDSKMRLVGHSLGGYLAAQYALRYGAHVKQLVLVSPVGVPERAAEVPKDVSVVGSKMPGWMSFLWERQVTPLSFIRSVGPYGPNLVARYTTARFHYLSRVEQAALTDYVYQITADRPSGESALTRLFAPGAWAYEPLATALRSLPKPAHFVYGEADWMDPAPAQALVHTMKWPPVAFVPAAGHQLYLDNPSYFNQYLVRLLKTCK